MKKLAFLLTLIPSLSIASGIYNPGSGGGGGGSGTGTINDSNQYNVPYYSVSGSSNVLSGASNLTNTGSVIIASTTWNNTAGGSGTFFKVNQKYGDSLLATYHSDAVFNVNNPGGTTYNMLNFQENSSDKLAMGWTNRWDSGSGTGAFFINPPTAAIDSSPFVATLGAHVNPGVNPVYLGVGTVASNGVFEVTPQDGQIEPVLALNASGKLVTLRNSGVEISSVSAQGNFYAPSYYSSGISTFTGVTDQTLNSGECVQTTTGGRLTTTGAACGSGSGSSGIFIATGSASGFSSSSTVAGINLDSTQFKYSVSASTAFVQLSTPVIATNGGTGQTTWAQGDIVVSAAANTLSALSKNTSTSRYVRNSGINNQPTWAQVDLTNGVTGILPPANVVSTTAYTNSTQTWTATQTFGPTTSSVTFNGGIVLSSAVIVNGTPGTTDQVFSSSGPGLSPYWKTISAGGGSPGGSANNVQYNNGSAFAGASGFNVNTSSIVISSAYTTYASTTQVDSSFTVTNVAAENLSGVALNLVSGSSLTIQDGSYNYTNYVSTGYANMTTLTTTSASTATVTGYTFQMPANSTWTIICNLIVTGVAGGMEFGFDIPTGGKINAGVVGNVGSATAFSSAGIISTASTVETTAYATASAAKSVQITGVVTSGVSAGSVSLIWKSVTGGNTSTINLGSFMRANRIL